MKKLFLLIPVLALSLLASATRQTISPSSADSDSNIRSALSGSADTVILNAGNYKEADQIHFRRTVVIMAAEGADVTITPKYYCDFVNENTKVKIIGIKFDGSISGQQAIRIYDDKAGKELRLENCEFYNFAKATISGDNSTYPLDSCIINNCYFHDCKKSAIYFAKSTAVSVQTCHGLIVKNSTFANIDVNESAEHYASVIDVNTYDYANVVASDVEVLVDHCTFYNFLTYNTDHCAVRVRRATKTTVSNCIFAHPTEQERRSTYCYNGLITNCLSYNLTKSTSSYTHASTGDNTITNCAIADPLFNDLANNRYTYAGNWVTMNISPARGAATDGSDLGDPRWYSDEVLPETDFATPYVFAPAKAKLNGRVSVSETNLLWDNNSDASLNGSATWKIHATRACYLSATINNNASNTSGHRFSIQVLDADGNSIGDPLAEPADSWSHVDDVLSGQIHLPAAGNYTVILSNATEWSKALLSSITFSYIGGAVQNLPGTTNIADALFSAEGTRADGKIDFPDGSIQDGWVKWNVAFASSVSCNVTVNIDNANGHNYTVALYRSESDDSPITISEGEQKGTIGTAALGAMEVPAGNYIMKVTNAVQWSDAKLISVTFAYAGGAAQNIPCAITLSDAILSSRAYIDGSGYLHFTDADHLGTISGEWVKWNIHAASEGVYTFTAHCRSTNWSNLTFKVLDTDENELYSYTPEWTYQSDDKTITSPEWILAAGDYVLKLSNPADGSDGYLMSLAAAKSDIIVLDENATSASVIHDNNGVSDKKIALMRSFKADMYNTICLPFEDWDSSLKLIFGTGYSLLRLKTATIDGDVLDLEFESVTTLGHGRPYLIKPTKDVTNPIFGTGHAIDERTSGYSTTVCDNADFIGTFIKNTIDASEYNLFLGANDKLYFSNNDVTIKGLRAYFHIKDNGSGAPIRKARIVEKDNIVTELELIDGEWQDIKSANGTIKTIENGQLILIRDGKRYNVMGIRF